MQPVMSDLVPFGEWRPDVSGPFGPFAQVATNVISRGKEYAAIESVVESAIGALPSPCRGCVAVKDRDGNVFVYAGTATKLYRLVSNAWVEATRVVGGDYATTDEGRWVFGLYGERLIADNYTDDTQYIDLGDTEFDALPNAPKARELAVVNNFVMMGNTFDPVDGARPNRIRWSALDDTESWAPSATTQSDFQDLENGYGAVRAVAGYQNYAIVMQERGILRANYVGAPKIFDIQVAEGNQGPIGGNTVAIVGGRIFYLAEAGFFMFNGVESVPIGSGKIDEWFFKNARPDLMHRISVSYNMKKKLVTYAFVSNDASTQYPDKMLAYNWVDARWTLIDQAVEQSFISFTVGKTVEDLGAEYGDLEDVPLSLDSPVYAGGQTLPAVITANHKVGFWNGPPMEGTVETGEARLNPNGRAVVSGICVISDAPGLDVRIVSRDLPNGADVVSGSLPISPATGEACARSDARFHRSRVMLSGVWSYARGAQYRFKDGGVR